MKGWWLFRPALTLMISYGTSLPFRLVAGMSASESPEALWLIVALWDVVFVTMAVRWVIVVTQTRRWPWQRQPAVDGKP